jgi:hypothetical protein
VLGSGQRCGSTLIQRLLTSHEGVLIWGEHGGHLRELISMQDILQRWDENVSEPGRQAFAEGGHQSWMANLLPGAGPLQDAARAYFRTLFGTPAAAMGRPRWGFKEVRFGFAEAAALRRLFPALVTVHVTRDPRDILLSLESWEGGTSWWRREYTEAALELWVSITRGFHEAADVPWVVSRRYEDVVAEPGAFIADVARLLGSVPDAFDASVFDRRIRNYEGEGRKLRTWDELPRELHALLDGDDVREVAALAGYELPARSSRRWRR